MIQIPRQLKDWRFILLGYHSKEPIEKDWQNTSNYAYDDSKLLAHLAEGKNYGVLLGRYNKANHIVIDADSPELEKLVREKLPATFSVRTGSGGLHFYYVIPDAD